MARITADQPPRSRTTWPPVVESHSSADAAKARPDRGDGSQRRQPPRGHCRRVQQPGDSKGGRYSRGDGPVVADDEAIPEPAEFLEPAQDRGPCAVEPGKNHDSPRVQRNELERALPQPSDVPGSGEHVPPDEGEDRGVSARPCDSEPLHRPEGPEA